MTLDIATASQPDRLITLREVRNITSLGASTIYAAIAARRFPSPYKLGRASRWSRNAVFAWIEQHAPASTPAAESA